MGADRASDGTDANAETVEEQPDRRPPPPADKPGTDGYPSRADSRNGAAAANDTSTQNIDQQAERKPDTVQEPQETFGEQGSTATGKPESPRTLESNEGASERYDNGPSQEVPGARPDTGQPPDEIGDPKDAGRREEAADGQTAPHDSTTPSETDEQAVSAGVTERAEDKGAEETPAAESTNAASPSTMDIGDRPDSAPKQAEDALVSGSDTQESPSDSLDAPADVAGDNTREPTRPADDTTEAAQTAEVEGQAETADKPQPNPTDQALPAIDGKASEHSGIRLTESEEESGLRPENSGSETDTGDEAKDDDATAPDRTLGERLTVDGKPLREHLDPVGEAAWSSDTGDQPGDPDDRKGDRIAKSEKDENSRPEKLRRKFHREGTDAVEDAGKAASHVKDILSHPPAGHMETRTGPTATSAPHDGASVTDTFTALVAAGVMIGEASRLVHKKLIQKNGA
jgi:hypothetical protein